MQVSNGTGQGSEYRVGTNSGGNMLQTSGTWKSVEPMRYGKVPLKSGESQPCSVDEPFCVEFWIGDKMVASESFLKDPGTVMLIEAESAFSIAVLNEKSAAA